MREAYEAAASQVEKTTKLQAQSSQKARQAELATATAAAQKRQKQEQALYSNQIRLLSKQGRVKSRLGKINNICYSLRLNQTEKGRLSVEARKECSEGNVGFYDPIRAKLRLFPIEKIPKMTNEYYFIQAGLSAQANKLEDAMQLCSRGLQLTHNSVLHRFTHGVIMFKLGLLTQAESDFRYISEQKPRKSYYLYNLALCLFQQGKYSQALHYLDQIVKLSYSSAPEGDRGQKRKQKKEPVVHVT